MSEYCTVNVRHSNWVTQPKSVLDIRLFDVICKLPIQLAFAFFVICFYTGLFLCFCAIQLQFGGRGETHGGLSEHLHRKLVTSQCQGNYTTVKQNDSQIRKLYDIFVNYNWVVTQWQQYSTHLHTNNTQNDTKQTIYRTTQQFWKSAGRAPSWLVIPWHLPYNQGKSTEKPQSG